MSRLTDRDKELLYGLTKSKYYPVLKRLFLENLIETVHIANENEEKTDNILRNQGYCLGIRDVFDQIEKATKQLRLKEEAEKIEEEIITNE